MSNGLKELVTEIKFKGKYPSIEAVAQTIGYSRVHLNNEMAKPEKSDLEDLLRARHKDILQSVSNSIQNVNESYTEKSVYELSVANKDACHANAILAESQRELIDILKSKIPLNSGDQIRSQPKVPTWEAALHLLILAGVKEGKWDTEDLGQDILDNALGEILK